MACRYCDRCVYTTALGMPAGGWARPGQSTRGVKEGKKKSSCQRPTSAVAPTCGARGVAQAGRAALVVDVEFNLVGGIHQRLVPGASRTKRSYTEHPPAGKRVEYHYFSGAQPTGQCAGRPAARRRSRRPSQQSSVGRGVASWGERARGAGAGGQQGEQRSASKNDTRSPS